MGKDPATGKTIRKSVYAKTQKEARLKMRQAIAQVDRGEYFEPEKLTVGEWLDVWLTEFNRDLRESSLNRYQSIVRMHLKPELGGTQLSALTTISIQKLVNRLSETLMPNTVHAVYGVLNKALTKAQQLGYVRFNACSGCELPTPRRRELKPLVDELLVSFLTQIKGTRMEYYYLVDLFTGLRESELMGLQCGDIDWKKKTITIQRQLRQNRETLEWMFFPVKNNKIRVITPANEVFRILREQRSRQLEWNLQAGELWQNPDDLVFTDQLGKHLTASMVYREFKKAVAAIGRQRLGYTT